MKPLASDQHSIDIRTFFTTLPGSNVLVQPDAPHFTIVAVSDDYLQAVDRRREGLVGKGLFEAFPNNPDDRNQVSEKTVRASLEYALAHKEPHYLPVQRYDVKNEAGVYEEHYWAASNKPVLADGGEVMYLIHTADNVTHKVKAEQREVRIKSIERAYGLFIQAPVMIGILKGDEYVIELANDSILELWHRGPEVIGMPLLKAIPEIKDQGFIEILDEVRRTGKPYYAYETPATLLRNGKPDVRYLDFVYQPNYEGTEEVASGVFAVAHDVTEQVTARKGARESEQRFRDLVAEATVATAVYIGREMKIQYANEAMIHLWGKDASVIGKTVRQALPELEGQPFHQQLDRVFTSGETYWGKDDRAELMVDGELRTFYFNFSYKALRNADGEIYGILNMATDVTEQVVSRKRIEEKNKELQFVMDVMPQLVWHTQPDGQVDFVNKIYLDYTGLPAEQLTGHQWAALVHPDDMESSIRLWQQALAGVSDTYTVEHRLRGRDGTYRWFLTRGVALKDDSGHILRWYGTTTDIQDQKTAAEVMRQSKVRFDLVAKATQDAIWDWDLVTDLIWWNEGFRAMFGYKEEDIEPDITSWYSRVHPDDRDQVVSSVHRLIEDGGKQWSGEYRFRKSDGSYATVFDRGYVLHDKSGKAVRMLGSMLDITERKQAEVLLERRVKERTYELELRSRELEQFTYVSHHDLQEPLRKIIMFSDMVKGEGREKLSEASQNRLEKVTQAATRMSAALRDVLNYASLSKQEQYAEVDLDEVLAAVQADLELVIHEKGAHVQADELPTVKAVAGQMHQLFYNLLNNALKFSKAGEPPQIRVTCCPAGVDTLGRYAELDPARTYYEIAVSDNGIGFKPESAERIFDMFQRLHSKDAYAGTGIGLALCKKVVVNHRGAIWAESQPGEGATFRVLLPAG